jgi:CRISPR-associated protein Csm1
MGGGGQFLLRVPAVAEADSKLVELRKELDQLLYSETRGELGLTLAWGRSLTEVLCRKEREKRRLWDQTMLGADGWRVDLMSMEDLGSPCEVCHRQRATVARDDDGEVVHVCSRCDGDTEIGKMLPQIDTVAIASSPAQFSVLACGLEFRARGAVPGGGPIVPRSLRRHVPLDHSGKPLTFDQIADTAKGDNLLGILKADADNVGVKLGEIARQDPSLEALRRFSFDLDYFFSEQVQGELNKSAWQTIYSVYSGGDDLLLVGPWNVVLDFAGIVHQVFAEGPGKKYGLTLSAAVSLTPYRVPIRHGVERADHLLEEEAKREPKNQCAALGGVWNWQHHGAFLDDCKQIVGWIESGISGRSLIHRLLLIAESRDPRKAALWAYQVGRNFPSRNAAGREERELRRWGEQALAGLHQPNASDMGHVAVGLRYALAATRPRRA